MEVNKIYNECCLKTMSRMPNGFVDMVICSPPYWGLRDYGLEPQIWDEAEGCVHEWDTKLFERKRGNINGPSAQVGNTKSGICGTGINQGNFCIKCNAWRGSLGLEPTYQLYLKHLIQIFDEIKRVLKDTGSCWVNIGDTYATHTGKRSGNFGGDINSGNNDIFTRNRPKQNMAEKSLIGIPERFVIAMTDRGWIRRNTIIWHKPNCMPSSVDDRFTVDFEYLYFFTKKKKYYFEQQFEEIANSTKQRVALAENRKAETDIQSTSGRTYKKCRAAAISQDKYNYQADHLVCKPNENGRNKRCVWNIPTEPNPEAHFATFPPALIVTPIKACCPEYICKKCGRAKEKIFGKTQVKRNKSNTLYDKKTMTAGRLAEMRQAYREMRLENPPPKEFKGYTDCGCCAPQEDCRNFEAGIVYDPFMGSGTTAKVALELNRKFIGSEVSIEYCRIAYKRNKQEMSQNKLSLQALQS